MTHEGKSILITGAAAGIGRGVALAFAEAGAKLALADVNDEGTEETAQLAAELGTEAITITCDVTDPDQVAAMIKQTADHYGTLDYAFNNAGIAYPADQQVKTHESDIDLWDRIMGVNAKGVYLCMRAEIRQMLEQPNAGVIVNTASLAGLVGAPRGVAYSASKHAVVGITKSAALEYARQGIRINAICPAFLHTPMVDEITKGDPEAELFLVRGVPMKRIGEVSEVVGAVLWLCSDDNSFMTGQTVALDGGVSAG